MSTYRRPAEWEPMARVWVSPPHNPHTWPGCVDAAREEFDWFLLALRQHVEVCPVATVGLETTDSWIRDYGPVYVAQPDGTMAVLGVRFNNWGGKYGGATKDAAVARAIAAQQGRTVVDVPLELEGGAVEVNGQGTLILGESSVLNDNRNPKHDRGSIEALLNPLLGVCHTIWLPGLPSGDDTDGHADNLARFVTPTTVLAPRAPVDHPDHAAYEANWAVLASSVDQDGRPLDLVPLPVPEPRSFTFPPGLPGVEPGPCPLPMSYANFLICNQAVFVPIYRDPADDVALATIQDALPGYRVFGLAANTLIVGQGSLHCLTLNEFA